MPLGCWASICSLYIGRMGQKLMLWPILKIKYLEMIGHWRMCASIPYRRHKLLHRLCVIAVSLAQQRCGWYTKLCPLCTASMCLAHLKCLLWTWCPKSLKSVICLVASWPGYFLRRGHLRLFEPCLQKPWLLPQPLASAASPPSNSWSIEQHLAVHFL